MSDPTIEQQVTEIVTDAVERIIRLLGRDDIEMPDAGSVVAEVPTLSRPAPAPRGDGPTRVEPTTDPVLRNFLGVDT